MDQLFTFPPDFTRAQRKQARICAILAALAGFFHVLQGAYFWWRGLDVYAVGNLFSVLAYLAAIVLILRARVMAGVLVVGLELLVYVSACAVTLGFDAGFYWYYLTITIVAYMMFRLDQKWPRRAWLFGFGLSGVAVTWVSRWTFAPDHVTETTLEQIYAINVTTNVLVLWAAGAFFASVSEAAEQEAERERLRAEKLLLNILPAPIAERLKSEPDKTIADHFTSVTVLFSDICGFTEMSSRIGTDELIGILNDIFSRFDRLATRHGLEKIKTIGDAYMVVGGLPLPVEEHARRVADMALDMRQALAEFCAETEHNIDVRIGIHTGPVVAGVIGIEKLAYDLWGDTVNVASRMESHGARGRIQVSASTRALLDDAAFDIEDRGTIEVKGKGPMAAYWLNGRRAA